MNYFKILDVSKLDRKKKYEFKVMYIDPKTRVLTESDWIPVQNEENFDLFINSFNEKYLFTGIIRRDGSSNFGPNNKFGIFPSFSTTKIFLDNNS